MDYSELFSFGSMACDEVEYALTDHGNPNVTVNRTGEKSTCEVQVYVTPRKCKSWKGGAMGWLIYAAANLFASSAEALSPDFRLDATLRTKPESRDSDSLKIYSLRSHRFNVVIGTLDTLMVDSRMNIFTLLSNAEHIDAVSIPINIFISMEDNYPHNSTESGKIYLVLPYRINDTILEDEDISINDWPNSTFMNNYPLITLSLGDISVHLLENKMRFLLQDMQTTWLVVCGHCVPLEDRLYQRDIMPPAKWRGYPAKEYIFLLMLFQNISILATQSSFISVTGKSLAFPTLESLPRPKNMLLFSPEEKRTGYYFVTCAGHEEVGFLSLKGMVSAFDYPTWACLICFSVATSVAIVWTLVHSKARDAVILAFSVLMEQGCLGNISKKSRWICGAWLLTGVVLSNIYRGDNITAITAPLPRSKLEYFQQLLDRNFSYYMTLRSCLEMKAFVDQNELFQVLVTAVRKDFYQIFEIDGDPLEDMGILPDIQIHPSSLAEGFSAATAMKNDTLSIIFKQTIWPMSSTDVKDFAHVDFFVPFVAECKQAFVSSFGEVAMMAQKLRTSLLEKGKNPELISRSKQPLTNTSYSWHLLHVPLPATYIFSRIQLLWSSGIFGMWEDFSIGISTHNVDTHAARARRKAMQPKKLDLKGNMVVIFLVYLMVISMASQLLVLELRRLLFSWIKIIFCKIRSGAALAFREFFTTVRRTCFPCPFRMLSYRNPGTMAF